MSSLDRKKLYKSLDDLEGSSSYKKFEHREFQEGTTVLDAPVSRRSFLKLMGATVALAGASGCSLNFRKPVQNIYPYAKTPEHDVPDRTLFFATSMQLGEEVVGLLAKSHEGRPIKLEGNPSHSQSLGASSAYHQASLLDLYDPDRQKNVSYNGKHSSMSDFMAWMDERIREKQEVSGKGLCLFTEAQMSPTFYRLLSRFKKKYPLAKVFRYETVNQDHSLHGIHSVTGRWLVPEYQYDNASVIVGLDADFLGTSSGSIDATRRFANGRDPELTKNKINRLYVFEPCITMTGSRADHRFAVKGSSIQYVLCRVAKRLVDKGVVRLPKAIVHQIKRLSLSFKTHVDDTVINAIVDDIMQHRRKSVFVAGERQPEFVHGLVYLLNQQLSAGKSVVYHDHPFASESLVQTSNLDALQRFQQAVKEGEIDTLICLGGNVLYDAKGDKAFTSAWNRIQHRAHLTLSENETSTQCQWIVPKSHYLESWGDLRAVDGSVSIVQPVIRPLYDSVQDCGLISRFIGSYSDTYRLVRKTWSATTSFSQKWRSFLHEGIISKATSGKKGSSYRDHGFVNSLKKRSIYRDNHYLELSFQTSSSMYDGRFSNNGWMQELPDPITKLTWDNAAIMSQDSAERYGLQSGDIVSLNVEDEAIEIAVYVIPGHVNDSLTLPIGYGRQIAGRVGERKGFDVTALRLPEAYYYAPKSLLTKTGKTYELASTQNHGSMENRALYRQADLDHYKKDPKFARHMVEVEGLDSLWDEHKYDKGNQWGMAIDLSRCTGCNACVVACQAENNIPIVGKTEVLKGREMHWMRVDRYFEGDGEAATAVHQPMTCLHCENAPCEQVCPVAATTHSEEGTNDMVYNRCVGTRYCADNCPTKVRRFNFFDYHQRNPQAQPKDRKHFFDYMKEPDQTVQLQFNPQVTVRMRGVMEKCTFCIQRIMKTKADSANEERPIQDGEIKTACQQSCSANAIVFGNILDKDSVVRKQKDKDRDYQILNELHLKSRLTYGAAVTNPNPVLVSNRKEESHDDHHG